MPEEGQENLKTEAEKSLESIEGAVISVEDSISADVRENNNIVESVDKIVNRRNRGRPKGSKDKKTIELKLAKKRLVQRVLRNQNKLLNSQFILAKGCSYLYVIHTDTDEKGHRIKQKPRLVENQGTIEAYLAGELEDEENDYYYITTDKPDNKALDSLLDRTFGRATQAFANDPENPIVPVIINRYDGNGGIETNKPDEISRPSDIQPV